MKTRLLGAAVLIALAVLFVPMFFSSNPPAPGGDQAVNLAIPPAPDRDLQTRTMSLSPDAVAGVIAALGARIDHWHLAGLDQATPRGLAVATLAGILQQTLPQASFDMHPDVPSALAAARSTTRPVERILAFGSFFVASAVLAERIG